jgi:hypothetical protein
MPTLNDALDLVIGTLQDAGIRAVRDARDLNPPAVLVNPPTVTFRFARGTFDAEWSVLAVAPNSGNRPALDVLSNLMERVAEALGGAPITGTPYQLQVDGESDPLPSYQLTWTDRIS